jgi:hypothetical protein
MKLILTFDTKAMSAVTGVFDSDFFDLLNRCFMISERSDGNNYLAKKIYIQDRMLLENGSLPTSIQHFSSPPQVSQEDTTQR